MEAKLTDIQVLRKAADLIEERGLVSRVRLNAEGQMCVLGALDTAKYGNAWGLNIDRDQDFLKVIADRLQLPPSCSISAPASWRLATWSNAQTDKMVVANGLRRVADSLEAESGKQN
jgi:hypothetical protein